ncbi:MAG: tRNA dihydrouridine synthase DusB [bacterium]
MSKKIFRDLIEECPVLPAPMCGISDRANRTMARRMGCRLVYTEMASSEAFVRGDDKTWELIDIEGEEAPVAVQLFGSRPDALAESAKMLEDRGVAVVDLNMGCPVRKVVRNDCGAALMRNPRLVGEIYSAMRKAISIPLTGKMRAGWDDTDISAVGIARVIESEGGDAVCLHARTRSQMFSEHADWDLIARLKSEVAIPVIGNGDVKTPDDALRLRQNTGCDAVMIGRGALGNPWLLRKSLDLLLGRSAADGARDGRNDVSQLFDLLLEHARLMVERKGERLGLTEFRKHCVNYLKGLPHSHSVKNLLMQSVSFAEWQDAMERLRESYLEQAAARYSAGSEGGSAGLQWTKSGVNESEKAPITPRARFFA